MIIVKQWQDLAGRFPRPVAALGKFDGVHRGHQKLLSEVLRLARAHDAPSMAITFDVHPYSLIRPHLVPPVVTTKEEKADYIGESGVDALLYLQFTPEFAQLTAWGFAQDYLAERIGAGIILAGRNFRFGRNRSGDVEKLRRWGDKLDFSFRVVPQIKIAGQPVSSTRVRKVIAGGDMPLTARLLGRSYSLEGIVAPGAGRGRSLGAPTANLRLPPKLLPPDGVYLVRASLESGEPAPALANLGFSPTFGEEERRLEVHLLDRKGRMYGKRMRVYFEKYLREERTFASSEALAKQISLDIRGAQRYFRGKA